MKLLAIVALAGLAMLLILPVPGPRVVELPAGTIQLHHEMLVRDGTELRGSPAGSVLHAADDFDGRAMLVVSGPGVTLRNIQLDGNRDKLEIRAGLPPSNKPFSLFTRGSGVLVLGARNLRLSGMEFRNIAGFAALVSRSRGVHIDNVAVDDSGSRDRHGRNNSTGGILLEEGTRDFHVIHSQFRNIRGNGVWTHSLSTSPRNRDGEICFNRFENLARDAVQVGHATNVRVEDNQGTLIGYPAELVDLEHEAYPVALDTAGDVDRSVYARNRFTEVDGKCIDLDGFHDGDILENSCVNRPDGALYPYGNIGILFNDSNPHTRSNRIRVIGNLLDGVKFTGIYAFGTGHIIAHNRLLNVNLAHCNEEAAKSGCYYPKDEPDALQSGIYLGRGFLWPEPARGIVVEDNEISGFGMKSHCIGFAPGVDRGANTVRKNRCE